MSSSPTAPAPADAGRPILVPDPPRLDGLRFRHYRGPQDHPGMIRVGTAARTASGILERVTVEGMDNDYASLTNSDRYRDVIVGELDDRIVAYGRIEWGDNSDGARDYTAFCFVDPAVRRHGVGRAMLGWQEARSREIAADQVTDRPRYHFSFANDRDPGGLALLETAGYMVVRRGAEMVRPDLADLPDAPLPAGLEIRPANREMARAVWEATVEIFRDHWGATEESQESYVQFAGDPRLDPSLWVVAWDGDQIAAEVLTSINEGEERGEILGYLDWVGVRRPWRRRGLGRAIVVEALRMLRARGATTVGLGVDLQNENEAARLYESVGFAVKTTSTQFRKPLVL